MKTKLLTSTFLLTLLLLTGCKSGPAPAPEKPDWVQNPGDGAVGYSGSHIRGRSFQEDIAITRARERLAARYGVEISSIQTIKERVVNDFSSVRSDKEINQRVQTTVVKAHVREVWQNPSSGEIWVWLYPE